MQAPITDDDPRRIGPFTVTARLGSGAMGRVYLGRAEDGTVAAVKLVRPDLADDPEFRRRFRQEVGAVRLVSGPHATALVAAFVAADTEAERPWLATEYLPGMSLRDEVRIRGPLPADEVRALAIGIATALAAIHAAGVVHRDLKPGNVILLPDGPRVIDFGIARAADVTTLTATGLTIGTPSYLAPEQVSGEEVGPAADVFALGALLTYAATGHTPFGDGPTSTILYRIAHDEPRLTGLPDSLRGLVTACLTKDPARRPTPAGLVTHLTDPEPTGAVPTVVHRLPDPVAQRLAEPIAFPPPSRLSPSRLPARLLAPAMALVAVAAAVFVPLSIDNRIAGTPFGGAPACQGTDNLTLAGTSLAVDVVERIATAYSVACPGKVADYAPADGRDAIERFTDGDVAMAVVDGPYYRYEVERPTSDCEVRLALLSARPVVVTFQLTGVDELTLDPSTVAKVFSGAVTSWRDPLIAEQNPRTPLPDLPIRVMHREDRSPVTALFQKYLSTTGDWPHGTGDTFEGAGGHAARGDDGLRKRVAETEGAVGYTLPGQDRIPTVRLGGVPPNRDTVTTAVTAAITSETLEIQPPRLFRPTVANAYGLVALSYAFLCADDPAARGFVLSSLTATDDAPFALPTGPWADRLRTGFQ